jgi:hypothetical protein
MAPMNSSSTRHAPSLSAETFTSCSLPPAIQKDCRFASIAEDMKEDMRNMFCAVATMSHVAMPDYYCHRILCYAILILCNFCP